MSVNAPTRTRRDRCPGVLRPWPAADGLLVRLRLIGGRVPSAALAALAAVSREYGDGRIHVTGRANLQLRALPGRDGALEPDVLTAIEGTGLLPSRRHDLVRNVMVSPQSGLAGGRVDLRPAAAALDRELLADPRLAGLPGRFLFVLDDGRGDLLDRGGDLGLVALDGAAGQLRIGDGWGPVVPLAGAAGEIIALALAFLDARGGGPGAAWHVAELAEPLRDRPAEPDPRLPGSAPPLRFGRVPGGRHVAVPPEGLRRDDVAALAGEAGELVVTPWRGVLVPGAGR